MTFAPGKEPVVTKVQSVPVGAPAPINFVECVSGEDDGVALASKPPPKRDPKTGKPVPPPTPPAAKEQVQIPAKTKPPSKGAALE